jgi:hypothetical protein
VLLKYLEPQGKQSEMRVYFTVDTECSIGGAWSHPDRRPVGASKHIFCRIGNDDFGIPLLTRIMGEFGFRATYFVETFATLCLGDADIRPVFDFLLREQQDVQLHTHPVFRQYAEFRKAIDGGGEYHGSQPMDLLGHMSFNLQMELLEEAIHHFETLAGYRPLAFRAGCWAGSRTMLKCLHRLGIRVDSSFNPCYHPEISFPEGPLEPNAVQKVEGVWEIPVNVARTPLPESASRYKHADCVAVSFPEIRAMLEATANAGQEHFVIVFHSFSAVKPKDETYAQMRPDRIVIRRLEEMFRYLADHPDQYQVDTMGNIAQNPEVLHESTALAMPSLGLLVAAKRKAVQLINNAYWV